MRIFLVEHLLKRTVLLLNMQSTKDIVSEPKHRLSTQGITASINAVSLRIVTPSMAYSRLC